MTAETITHLEVAMEIVAPMLVAVAVAFVADAFVLRPLLRAMEG